MKHQFWLQYSFSIQIPMLPHDNLLLPLTDWTTWSVPIRIHLKLRILQTPWTGVHHCRKAVTYTGQHKQKSADVHPFPLLGFEHSSCHTLRSHHEPNQYICTRNNGYCVKWCMVICVPHHFVSVVKSRTSWAADLYLERGKQGTL
jgi:hypothetical protein